MKFMENSDDPAPGAKIRTSTWFALSIVGVQILVSLIAYPFMPTLVPSHWNAAGEVNGYMSRLGNAIFVPAMSLGSYILSRLLLVVGPRLGSNTNRGVLLRLADYLLCGILLFLLAMQLIVTAAALRLPVDIGFMINLAVAILFIFLGNYLGKVQRNFWIGIRTPWTLASDTVWERTHRLGGWLFVAAGIIMLMMDFFTPLRHITIIAPILLVAVVLTLYSFLIYRRLSRL